jgi:hypothetical protein
MKTAVSVASLLICALSLDAQIIATLNRLPAGLDEVRIRNNSAIALVAFVVTVQQVPLSANASSAPLVVYSDPLIEPAAKPLLPGEDRLVMRSRFADPTGRSRRLLDEPVTAAGIFDGGTTAGDTVLLTRLMFRRSSMLQAVETALETLSAAGRRNISREQLVKQFSSMADFLNRWYLSPEQQVGRGIYQSIAGKLMNLPEGELGSPFPPSAFVAHETAILNRQRVTLLESQPGLESAAFVAGRLEPPAAPKPQK